MQGTHCCDVHVHTVGTDGRRLCVQLAPSWPKGRFREGQGPYEDGRSLAECAAPGKRAHAGLH